jgi:hypothetical protein
LEHFVSGSSNGRAAGVEFFNALLRRGKEAERMVHG